MCSHACGKVRTMIPQRIERLRKEMSLNGIDYYIIPTSDFHSSEYVSDYFKCREYISGFTGSAGTVVVSIEEAILWTDGRYFIQAEKQLKGTGIELMKLSTPGFPSIKEFVKKKTDLGLKVACPSIIFSIRESTFIFTT